MRGLKTVKGDGRWAWYLAEDSMSYDHQTEGGGLKELSLSHVQLFSTRDLGLPLESKLNPCEIV